MLHIYTKNMSIKNRIKYNIVFVLWFYLGQQVNKIEATKVGLILRIAADCWLHAGRASQPRLQKNPKYDICSHSEVQRWCLWQSWCSAAPHTPERPLHAISQFNYPSSHCRSLCHWKETRLYRRHAESTKLTQTRDEWLPFTHPHFTSLRDERAWAPGEISSWALEEPCSFRLSFSIHPAYSYLQVPAGAWG